MTFLHQKKLSFFNRLSALTILLCFLGTAVIPPSFAQETFLPAPGTMVHLSDAFNPPLLKGIKVYPDNPFRLDFILNNGTNHSANDPTQKQAIALVKYFLTSVTVPESDLWVNLSPYEKDRIVPHAFGVTKMGRDLLAQDYLLKQITASVIYPEEKIGKEFWAKVHAETYKRFGTTDVPVDTFNKVWIVPEKAVIYENKDAAYVVETHLKVMLEEDYVAMSNQKDIAESRAPARDQFPSPAAKNLTPPNPLFKKEGERGDTQATPSLDKEGEGGVLTTNALGSQVIREIVLPILEKEVNEGKNFAQLRQIYHSLILAIWFKDKIKQSIFGQAYVDHNKISGVDIADKTAKEKIWAQYVESFKKGTYNYIKEEVDPLTQETLPRKYFSGGAGLNETRSRIQKIAELPPFSSDDAASSTIVTVDLNSTDGQIASSTVTNKSTASALDENPFTEESPLLMNTDTAKLYGNKLSRFFPKISWPKSRDLISSTPFHLNKFTLIALLSLTVMVSDQNHYLAVERNETKKIQMTSIKTQFANPVKIPSEDESNINFDNSVARAKQWDDMLAIQELEYLTLDTDPAIATKAKKTIIDIVTSRDIPIDTFLTIMSLEIMQHNTQFLKIILLQDNLPDFYYYHAGMNLIDIVGNKDLPRNLRLEALKVFETAYAKRMEKIATNRNYSQEVTKVVTQAIDGVMKNVETKLSVDIQKKYGRAPQKILYYLTIPDVVLPIIEAAKKIGPKVDIDVLTAVAFAEGYIELARSIIIGNKLEDINVMNPVGLDRFGAVQDKLKKSKFLRANYDGFTPTGQLAPSEKEQFPDGYFKNPSALLEALWALWLEDKQYYIDAVKKKGVNINRLSEDEIRVGTYLHYVTTTKTFNSILNRGGSLVGAIGLGEQSHGNPIYNAQWPAATREALKAIGIFSGIGNEKVNPTKSSSAITIEGADTDTKGGIDLTGDKMRRQLTTTGNSVEFTFTPEMIDRVQNAPGFTPVIINMQPLINLPLFLGLKQNQPLSVATAEKL